MIKPYLSGSDNEGDDDEYDNDKTFERGGEDDSDGVANMTEDKQTGERASGEEVPQNDPNSAIASAVSVVLLIFSLLFA